MVEFRTGIGHDIHRLVRGKNLVLGGVLIPADVGFEIHSDGDVLCHALIDALAGAIAVWSASVTQLPHRPSTAVMLSVSSESTVARS